MSEIKNTEFEKSKINLASFFRNIANCIYEYDNDVEFSLSKKYVKQLLKGLKHVSVHKNREETVILFIANNPATDTHYMTFLVGDNKTQIYKVKQIESNEKQYQGLSVSSKGDKTHKILFSEKDEIKETKRK